MKEQIESLKEVVEYCLQNYPETRSCDRELLFRVYLKTGFATREKKGILFKYENLKELPNFESIRRTRQKLQEEGHFLPLPSVKEERKNIQREMNQINRWWPNIGMADGMVDKHQTVIIKEEY